MGWTCTQAQSKTLESLMNNREIQNIENSFLEFSHNHRDYGAQPFLNMEVKLFRKNPNGFWNEAGYIYIRPNGEVVNHSAAAIPGARRNDGKLANKAVK